LKAALFGGLGLAVDLLAAIERNMPIQNRWAALLDGYSVFLTSS
jgi:hypothetical protein